MNSYTFYINLYDLAFIGAIFTGLTFALLLWFTKTVNRSANRFLALALATMILWMIWILGIDLRLETYLPGWDRLPMQFLLTLGPLMYFYVLKITSPQHKFSWMDVLHFSPLLIEQTIFGFEIRESARTGAATYATQTFQQLNPILQLLIFISVITYLYQSYKLIERFYGRLQLVMMDRSRLEFRWLRRLLAATALLWLFWFVCSAVDYFGYHHQLGIQTYYPFYIFFAVIIIWTAAAAFLRPQAAITAQVPAPVKQPVPAELRAKGVWLKRAMEANLYYQDPELSLSSLAEKLGLHPHDLSRIINTALKKSFNDFINEYRVRDVISKMQDPAYDRLTMVGIAFEAGFNSKTTFNRTFKQMTGKSAAEFKNTLEKDGPSYQLGPWSRTAAVISSHQVTQWWPGVKLNRNYMFRNYFKTALRSLTKQKGLSFISIFGLSLGIACFSLFALYALNEFNFDSFNKNAANVYRVYQWRQAFGGNDGSGNVYLSMPLAPAMKQDLPGVENYVRYMQPFETFIKTGNEGRREKIGFADPAFFSAFSLKLKYGIATTALKDINSVVLTEETAERLFGTTDIVGKTFDIKMSKDFQPFIVSAVAENPPSNSSFQFGMIASMEYWSTTDEGQMTLNNWGWASYLTFVQLKPGSALEKDKILPASFRAKYFPNEEKNARAQDGWKGANSPFSYRLEPLREIHTDTRFLGTRIPPVDPKMIWILLGIATGVLLIACINFTTLAIGRSAGRSREVGVRKVMGGTRKKLVFQFLTETLLLTVISAVVGLVLANILLPFFNVMAGRQLHFSLTQFPELTVLFAGLILSVGLLAGIYPSLVLSRFKPVEVLKTKIKLGGSNFFTRSLVTVQFVISAGLIICAIVILQQLYYMQNKNLGFNKNNVVVVEAVGSNNTKDIYARFKQGLMANPQIAGVAGAENGLGENEGLFNRGFDYRNKPYFAYQYSVDPDFMPVLGVQLAAGRNFNDAIASDTVTSVIINEELMNEMGFDYNNVIGQKITGFGNPQDPIIIGVVKNINFLDLKQKVAPQMFNHFAGHAPMRFFVRLKPGDPSRALAAIETMWRKVAPVYPLKYNFLDEDLNRFYQAEQRLGNIITWAGGISIFLACLGLLGLAALAAINRTKEIGIRKVLGASISTIVSLISKDFLKLIVIAFIIAAPLAWYLMNNWLQDYAYRISIGWQVFAISGIAIAGVALITISVQAIKAAMANPVKSLRTE